MAWHDAAGAAGCAKLTGSGRCIMVGEMRLVLFTGRAPVANGLTCHDGCAVRPGDVAHLEPGLILKVVGENVAIPQAVIRLRQKRFDKGVKCV